MEVILRLALSIIKKMNELMNSRISDKKKKSLLTGRTIIWNVQSSCVVVIHKQEPFMFKSCFKKSTCS